MNSNIYQNLPVPLVVFGKGLDIVSANTAFCRLVNHSHSDSLKNFSEYTDQKGIETLNILFNLSAENTAPPEVEVSLLTDDGNYKKVKVSAGQHRDGCIACFTDVSCYVSRQIAAEEFNKLAESGRMIKAIAHQWKQPLNSLMLIIQNMADAGDEGNIQEMKSYAEMSAELINHMADTLDNFLNYLSSHKNITRFEVKDILPLIYSLLSPRFKEQNIECRAFGCCGLCLISTNQKHMSHCSKHQYLLQGSVTALQQVILNILINAADAVEDKETKLIELKLAKEGGFLYISVYDTGGGIDSRIIRRVFDSDFSTKKSRGGSGIGLYISKKLVEEYFNGSMTAENFGTGTRITVKLPLCVSNT